MTDKSKHDAPAAEKPAEKTTAPAVKTDPLLTCLEGWCKQFSTRDAAKRLRKALVAEGIDTTEALASASITTVADVLRAELRLDAQSLTAAAATFKEH